MASDFFRVERGFEIFDASDVQSSLVQILTGTARPDTQADAIAAPVGSLWIVNAGNSSTTRVYQKFRQSTSDLYDWRDITSSISWLEPVKVTDTSTWANIAALETELNDLGTPGNVGGVASTAFVNGDRILVTDLTTGTEGVYIVNGTPGSGATLVLDPSNDPTDGDAVFTQEGTYADLAWLYNGTAWVQYGSGSAAEEGYIRAFIGKNGTGAEKPDYQTPSENFDSPNADEDANRDPFTDAVSANGYVVARYDNLELAIAKLNQEFFQNNRHLYATGVTTLSDTLPTWVDGAKWIVRVEQGAKVRQYEVHATTDGTNVDYTNYSLVRIGLNITGLNIAVTIAGGALVLTASSTGASTFEIRRMGTVGVPFTAGRALHI